VKVLRRNRPADSPLALDALRRLGEQDCLDVLEGEPGDEIVAELGAEALDDAASDPLPIGPAFWNDAPA
jgi:uncharacterized protein (DUF2336 family)